MWEIKYVFPNVRLLTHITTSSTTDFQTQQVFNKNPRAEMWRYMQNVLTYEAMKCLHLVLLWEAVCANNLAKWASSRAALDKALPQNVRRLAVSLDWAYSQRNLEEPWSKRPGVTWKIILKAWCQDGLVQCKNWHPLRWKCYTQKKKNGGHPVYTQLNRK